MNHHAQVNYQHAEILKLKFKWANNVSRHGINVTGILMVDAIS